MSFEIERKFLLFGAQWREHVARRVHIRQAYLSSDGKASIRVRIRDSQSATLSIKSLPAELRRLELEYPLSIQDAETLMQLRCGAILEKVRHIVPVGDLDWEVDVFLGENDGLIIAEIEMSHIDQAIELPDWIGREVTGEAPYYNSSLVQRPFRTWQDVGQIGAPSEAPT